MSDSDFVLDASGLNCPLPIMKAKKAMLSMPVGSVLKVIATDPGSIKDFPALCKTTGYELVSSADEDEKYIYFVRKTA